MIQHLKVSKSRKQILKFSFEPKTNNFFVSLPLWNGSNQKTNASYHIIAIIFLNWLILEARAEIHKKLLVFGSTENFEICLWDLLTFNKVSANPSFQSKNQTTDVRETDEITSDQLPNMRPFLYPGLTLDMLTKRTVAPTDLFPRNLANPFATFGSLFPGKF